MAISRSRGRRRMEKGDGENPLLFPLFLDWSFPYFSLLLFCFLVGSFSSFLSFHPLDIYDAVSHPFPTLLAKTMRWGHYQYCSALTYQTELLVKNKLIPIKKVSIKTFQALNLSYSLIYVLLWKLLSSPLCSLTSQILSSASVFFLPPPLSTTEVTCGAFWNGSQKKKCEKIAGVAIIKCSKYAIYSSHIRILNCTTNNSVHCLKTYRRIPSVVQWRFQGTPCMNFVEIFFPWWIIALAQRSIFSWFPSVFAGWFIEALMWRGGEGEETMVRPLRKMCAQRERKERRDFVTPLTLLQ